jgi:lysophospholipase L1-like esterase
MMNQPHTQKASGATRKIPTRRKFVYASACLFVALLLCEGAVRVRAWWRYGTSATGITNTMIVYNDEYELKMPQPGYELHAGKIWIKINSLGFRGDEITIEKPPSTLRIACVGASTTFCSEVSSNRAAWPAQLQEVLQARYPEITVQVVNAGIPGAVATDSVKNLRRRVLPLDPDLVIFYEANNDIAFDTMQLARKQGLIEESETHRSGIAKAISEYSLLFDLIHKNLRITLGRNSQQTGKLQSLPPDLAERFIGRIDEMHQSTHDRGASFVLSSFLVKYRRDQDRQSQLAHADIAFYYMPWMTIDGLLDAVDLYDAAIVDYANSHDIPVLAERDSIPADDEHFADCIHMADAGCALMAQRFGRFFEETELMDRIVDRIRLSSEPALTTKPDDSP